MKLIQRLAAIVIVPCAIVSSTLPVLAVGVTPFYDTSGPRGTFFCGGPPTTWSKTPILGTVGRVLVGKGYIAGVAVKQLPRELGSKGALVRFGVRVDGAVRLSEQEYSIDDLTRETFKATRRFRVNALEKRSVLTGSGTRFGPEGSVPFRSTIPGNLYSASEIAAAQSIQTVCATPEDFPDGNTQEQLSKDLELLLKLIGARSKGRIFRPAY
jgi:hypothetical protein